MLRTGPSLSWAELHTGRTCDRDVALASEDEFHSLAAEVARARNRLTVGVSGPTVGIRRIRSTAEGTTNDRHAERARFPDLPLTPTRSTAGLVVKVEIEVVETRHQADDHVPTARSVGEVVQPVHIPVDTRPQLTSVRVRPWQATPE